MTKQIIVASNNPVKIRAAEIGFSQIFPDNVFNFVGQSVSSGVSDQPMTDSETLSGALNRSKNARANNPTADFWVGIEGGVERLQKEMYAFAWIVVLSNKIIGKARSSNFQLPPKIVALIDQGKELGEADDIVFGSDNSKQKSGAIGLLTHNIIDRTELYIPAVISALIPFVNERLY